MDFTGKTLQCSFPRLSGKTPRASKLLSTVLQIENGSASCQPVLEKRCVASSREDFVLRGVGRNDESRVISSVAETLLQNAPEVLDQMDDQQGASVRTTGA